MFEIPPFLSAATHSNYFVSIHLGKMNYFMCINAYPFVLYKVNYSLNICA